MTAVNAMIWLVIMVVMNILETSFYFKKTFLMTYKLFPALAFFGV